MSGSIGLILDGLIVLLLAGTIVSATILNARLKVLRDSRKDFERMVAQFDEATRRADAGVKTLQNAAQKTGDVLQKQVERGQRLRDELSIMLDSAENLARRLENATPQASGAKSAPESSVAPRSKAEQDLLKAMKREGER